MDNLLASSAMDLRRAVDDDVEKFVEIEKNLSDWGWSKKNFEDALKNHECWVLYPKKKTEDIIGYLVLQTILDELHLLNICVNKTFQRQGWGRLLMDVVLEQALQKSCSVIYLELRASNKIARALYRKYGFKQIGQRKNYYPLTDSREDARLMSKLID